MSVFNGMSAKDFLSSVENKIAYAKDITSTVIKKSKVLPFIAKSENDERAIIKGVQKTLEEGNVVGVEFQDELLEAGARGNVSFNASKEELKSIKMFVKVDSMQHSVPSTNNITLPQRAKNFISTARTKLKNWGTMMFDKIIISAFSANCTNIVACGHHADGVTTNITQSDVFSLADLEEAKRRAELGIAYDASGNEIEVPPLIPFMQDTSENVGFYEELDYYVTWVGTDSARNVKNDPNYEIARKDAMDRGKNNPLFTGALGFWDGVLMLNIKTDTKRQSGILTSKSEFHGFSNVKYFDLSTYAGDGGIPTEINLMLGAGAGVIVVDKGFSYYEWEDKDDPRRMHVGIDRVFGFAKQKYSASDNDGLLKDSPYNNKDFGVIAIVAATGKAA